MSPSRLALPALALLAALALAPPVAAYWPHSGAVSVAPAALDEEASLTGSLADGAGGIFIAFQRDTTTGSAVYVTRLTAAGDRAAGWPASGTPVGGPAVNQGNPALVSDGAGGVLVTWIDRRGGVQFDVYAQRLTGTGARASGWPATGLAVASQPGNKYGFSVCSDGAGGEFVAYTLSSGQNDNDVDMSHVTPAGAVSGGTVLAGSGQQQNPVVAVDGAGGFFVAFENTAPGNSDIDIAHYNAALAPVFAPRSLVDQPSAQTSPQIVSIPTAGGNLAIVAFSDARIAAPQIYYDYASFTGQVGYDYGYPLESSTYDQRLYALRLDDAGGFYAAWVEGRPGATGLYLDHLTGIQQRTPGWPTGGLFLGAGTDQQIWYVGTATDGANGLLVEWTDENWRSGSLFGTHVDAYGALRPLMRAGGQLVLPDPGDAIYSTMVSDGQGGGIMVWRDYPGAYEQVRAQHVDPFLVLGDARPASEGVKDLPADQGGAVRLTWDASWFDNMVDHGIGAYWIWRQAPLALAQAAVASGEGAWSDAGAAEKSPARRTFRRAASASGYAWEFLASQPANASSRYSYVAATTLDSTAGDNPPTVFMVEAHAAADANAFWDSAPDSGYSVDNLPPPTPAPFLGSYSPSLTSLSWGAVSAPDLAGYRLYRGAGTGFVPGPGNLVAALGTTTWSAPAPAGIYKLTAIDVHGNESPVATLVPAGVAAVGDEAPGALSFALLSSNPGGAGATLRFTLPVAGELQLAIYDATGREVRRLADGARAAGAGEVTWDGRDAAGRPAPSGLYFARLRAGGLERTLRLARTR